MLKNEKFEKKSLSDRQLCAIIWDIYEEKIKADKADDAVQNQRDEMDEFVDLPMKESVESFAARFDMIVQDLVVQEKCTSDGKTVAGYLQTW